MLAAALRERHMRGCERGCSHGQSGENRTTRQHENHSLKRFSVSDLLPPSAAHKRNPNYEMANMAQLSKATI
jgi:hypothetical protein